MIAAAPPRSTWPPWRCSFSAFPAVAPIAAQASFTSRPTAQTSSLLPGQARNDVLKVCNSEQFFVWGENNLLLSRVAPWEQQDD